MASATILLHYFKAAEWEVHAKQAGLINSWSELLDTQERSLMQKPAVAKWAWDATIFE